MENMNKTHVAAIIVALGIVLSSLFLSKLFVRIKHEQDITVKGYAEKSVISDIGKFECSFSARRVTLNSAYRDLQKSKKIILAFLKKKGVKKEEIELGNIGTQKIFKKDPKGNTTNEIEYNTANQSITITSNNVQLIKDVHQKITELIKNGIDLYAGSPKYYVSNLDDIKVELIAKATENGYQRAGILALNSGGKVGALSSARQGVFQITAPNSTEISGYGVYSTSTIKKVVKAVVTLEYMID
ncbi:MAG TPA: hypothetical protein DCO77_00390 [Nitrospiraceae bacterium]|nr:hypothetical protein [Nitrospiraceae bacterium]